MVLLQVICEYCIVLTCGIPLKTLSSIIAEIIIIIIIIIVLVLLVVAVAAMLLGIGAKHLLRKQSAPDKAINKTWSYLKTKDCFQPC